MLYQVSISQSGVSEIAKSTIDTELKARIQAFKAEKKGKKIAKAGLMDMDTTAG